MEFEINYCNSFDYARLVVNDGKLNIVLAPNGTGKSTIAKAIQLSSVSSQGDIKELLPFRYRESNPSSIVPSVICDVLIDTVMCFNEEYVDQIVFQPDELVANSFDIFIRNDRYRELEAQINNILNDIKNMVAQSQELELLISNLKELGESFKLSRKGISKTSSGMRSLARGNTIQHIPEGLEGFASFIQSEERVNWIDWQIKGYAFLDITEQCPFCISETTGKEEQIRRVGVEYNKTTIRNLMSFIETIGRLGEYFSEEARVGLRTIANLPTGPEQEHEEFLTGIIQQINTFIQKLVRIRTLSGFDFEDGESVSETLPHLKIDLSFFDKLDSERTRQAVEEINNSIDRIVEQSSLLQGIINRQRREISRLASEHEQSINDFLEFAGYNYRVEVVGDDDKAQMKLKHIEFSGYLDGGKQHLSFGERNAFAIVLFMYECLAKKPQLIVLDDPISSFDKSKKYSILEMLFRRDARTCLKGRTVLLLTHDVEPVIDTMKAVYNQFGNQTNASYLVRNGARLAEVAIQRDDIQAFGEICNLILSTDKDNLIKAIYLRRRMEITDEKGDAYQVLSNLFHKREQPTDSRLPRSESEPCPRMSEHDLERGYNEIKQYINDFDYNHGLNRILSADELKRLYWLCENGYEKLQVFRLLGVNANSSIVQKYVNETYHVENEYISQLNPLKFDLIPGYITEICDGLVRDL